MWKLVIEDDEGKRTVVPLSRDDYTIGRQEGNTIRLTERNVSRNHGRVRRNRSANGAGSVFVLEDLRSYNGLFVNGLRVAHTQDLQHGDLIQIGDYRIVLQDDAAGSADATIPIAALDVSDAKATIPIAPAYRGQTLTERPNRLVMLVGPTPGVEYPLDRERMTIGRAEDASISVNHNSVSRLHCEVHALGDGRFEIVDKGSSNGVRVNAVELRRSIIEAGDVIELGDVRFKFVGAGQIFVPGPNESQQLTAISDREAELVIPKKGLGGYFVPVVGAGVVGAMIILAFVYVLRARAAPDDGDGRIEPDTAQATLADPLADPTAQKQAVDPPTMQEPAPTPTDLPTVATTKDSGGVAVAPVPPAPTPTARTTPTPHAAVTNAPAPAPAPAPKPSITNAPAPAPTPKQSSSNALEKAREAALRGEPAVVRQLLEQKVRNGHGTSEEANLVRQACKAMSDRVCSEDVKSKYP